MGGASVDTCGHVGGASVDTCGHVGGTGQCGKCFLRTFLPFPPFLSFLLAPFTMEVCTF